MHQQTNPQILLVEDNPGDVRLIVEAFKSSRRPPRLSVVKDGVEAMAFLRQEGHYAGAGQPDLILLDLNLPKKDGREVLAEIKGDPGLQHIPIIVLTTSDAAPDIRRCYELQANCYIPKPVDLKRFMKVIHLVDQFWLHTVRLPTR